MKLRSAVLLSVVFVFFFSLVASASSSDLQPGSSGFDTYIHSSTPYSSQGNNSQFAVGESDSSVSVNRSLIKFDVSSIPSNAIVSSAVLYLTVSLDRSSNARTLRAYYVSRSWTESGAVWDKYDGTNSWTAQGGDYGGSIGSVSLSSSESVGTVISISLDTTTVQGWISGSVSNQGLLLKMDTESDDAYLFYSSDDSVSSNRPKLSITWALPTSTPTSTLTPTPTRTPIYSGHTPTPGSSASPTPALTQNALCPSGAPIGYGMVTPDASWLAGCGQCLPSATPVSLSSIATILPKVFNTNISMDVISGSAELDQSGLGCNGLTCNLDLHILEGSSVSLGFSFQGIDSGVYDLFLNDYASFAGDLRSMGSFSHVDSSLAFSPAVVIEYEGGRNLSINGYPYQSIYSPVGGWLDFSFILEFVKHETPIIISSSDFCSGEVRPVSPLWQGIKFGSNSSTGSSNFFTTSPLCLTAETGWYSYQEVISQFSGSDHLSYEIAIKYDVVVSLDQSYTSSERWLRISSGQFDTIDTARMSCSNGCRLSGIEYVTLPYYASISNPGTLFFSVSSMSEGDYIPGDQIHQLVRLSIYPTDGFVPGLAAGGREGYVCDVISDGSQTYAEGVDLVESVIDIRTEDRSCSLTIPAFASQSLVDIVPDWLFSSLPQSLLDMISDADFPGMTICFIPVQVGDISFLGQTFSTSLILTAALAGYIVNHLTYK